MIWGSRMTLTKRKMTYNNNMKKNKNKNHNDMLDRMVASCAFAHGVSFLLFAIHTSLGRD